MMQCPTCHEGMLKDDLIETWAQRASRWIMLRNIPTMVCDACGEKSFSQVTTERLAKLTDSKNREAPTGFRWCMEFDLLKIDKQIAEGMRPIFVTGIELVGIISIKKVFSDIVIKSDNIIPINVYPIRR